MEVNHQMDMDHTVHEGGYPRSENMGSIKILLKLADLRLTSPNNSHRCSPCSAEYFEHTQKVAILSTEPDKNRKERKEVTSSNEEKNASTSTLCFIGNKLHGESRPLESESLWPWWSGPLGSECDCLVTRFSSPELILIQDLEVKAWVRSLAQTLLSGASWEWHLLSALDSRSSEPNPEIIPGLPHISGTLNGTVPSPRGLYNLVQNGACIGLPPPHLKAALAWDLPIAVRFWWSLPLFQPVFLPSGAGEAGFHTGDREESWRQERTTTMESNGRGCRGEGEEGRRIWRHRAREGARTCADKSPLRRRRVSMAHVGGGAADGAEYNQWPGTFCVSDVSGSALRVLDGLLNSRSQSPLELGTEISTLQIKQKEALRV